MLKQSAGTGLAAASLVVDKVARVAYLGLGILVLISLVAGDFGRAALVLVPCVLLVLTHLFISRSVMRHADALVNEGRRERVAPVDLAQTSSIVDTDAPFVLYLRPFLDDTVSAISGISERTLASDRLKAWHGDASYLRLNWATQEERLTSVVTSVGQVVAIGRPGEDLPQLGATRIYVSDAEWQRVVRSCMQRARLVLIRLGASENVWWEMSEALRRLEPDRVVLVVPADREAYAAASQRIKTELGTQLPTYFGPGFMYFSDQWEARTIAFDIDDIDVGKLKRALEPVLQHALPAPSRFA